MGDYEGKECANCKKNVAANNYVIHTAQCERKFQLCRLCEEPVLRIEIDNHLLECHSMESCSYCALPIEKWKLPHHQEEECFKRPGTCEYCNQHFPYDTIIQHKNVCGSTAEKCSSCDSLVNFKDKDDHLKSCKEEKNVQMLISCKYCSLEVLQKNYVEHEISCGSRTEKCLNCDQYVTFKEKKQHENICGIDNTCDSMLFCDHCEEEIPWNVFQDHFQVCGSRKEKCFICNEYVKIQDLYNHLDFCKKDKRLIDKFAVCEHCNTKIPSYKLSDHVSKCGYRMEKCSSCYDFIRVKDIDFHHANCQKNKPLRSPIFCNYCELEIPFDDFDYHKAQCGAQVYKCMECNRIIKRRDEANHMETCKKICLKEEELKNSEKIVGIEIAQDLNFEERPISCSFCDVEFPFDCLKDHVETCTQRTEICPNCKEKIFFQYLEEHKESCKPKPIQRFPLCQYCKVHFQSSTIEEHFRTCKERIVKCPKCKLNVMVLDMKKHQESCRKPLTEEKCPLCVIPIPFNDMKSHYEDCFNANSNISFEATQNSTNLNKLTGNMMPSSQPKKEEFVKNSMIKCPYCLEKILERMFNKHKKYCSKAFKKCQFCEEIFHIEEEKNHNESCVVLKKECNMSDFKSDKQNKFDSFAEEKKVRKQEMEVTFCPVCENRILNKSFTKHLSLCERNQKQCKFCYEIYHKNKERSHLEICWALNGVQQDYQGRTSMYTEMGIGKKKYESCLFCKKLIPIKEMDSHQKKFCEASMKCPFCKMRIQKYDKSHLDECVKKYGGAKPKTKERGIFNTFKSWFIPDGNSSNDSQFDYHSGNIFDGNDFGYYREVHPSAPNPEVTFIPCEFCEKSIFVDDIIVHETQCQPELVSLPSARSKINEVNETSYGNSDGVHQVTMLDDEDMQNKEIFPVKSYHDATHSQVKREHIENYTFVQNLYPKCDIDPVSDHTQENNLPDDISLQRNHGNNRQRDNRTGDEDEVMNSSNAKKSASSIKSNLSGKMTYSHYQEDVNLEENRKINQCKRTEISCDSESMLFYGKSQEFDKSQKRDFTRKEDSSRMEKENFTVTQKLKNYETDGSSNQSEKRSPVLKKAERNELNLQKSGKKTDLQKSGELLNNFEKYQQMQLKITEEARNLDSFTSGKLSHSSKTIDVECSSSKTIDAECKSSSSFDAECNTSKTFDTECLDSSLRRTYEKENSKFHHNIKTAEDLKGEYCSNDFSVKDYNKAMETLKFKISQNKNSFHFSNTPNIDFSRNEPSTATDNKNEETKEYLKRNEDSNALESEFLKKNDCSIISSSKMQGPIKIERLSVRKTNNDVDQPVVDRSRFKAFADYTVDTCKEDLKYSDVFQRTVHPYLNCSEEKEGRKADVTYMHDDICEKDCHFKNLDLFQRSRHHPYADEFSKEKKSTMNKEGKDGNTDNACNVDKFKHFNRKQYFANEILTDQPMEIDEEQNYIPKSESLTTKHEYLSQMNKYAETTEFEAKDSNMESYYKFLNNEKPENSPCEACKNEMCVCKIRESLLSQKSNSHSDVPKTNDFHSFDRRESSRDGNYNEDPENINDPKYTMNKSSKKYKKEHSEEKWDKWRMNPSSDSE